MLHHWTASERQDYRRRLREAYPTIRFPDPPVRLPAQPEQAWTYDAIVDVAQADSFDHSRVPEPRLGTIGDIMELIDAYGQWHTYCLVLVNGQGLGVKLLRKPIESLRLVDDHPERG